MSIGIGLCDGPLGHACGFTVLMLEEKERGKFGEGRRARRALLVSLGQRNGGGRMLSALQERHSMGGAHPGRPGRRRRKHRCDSCYQVGA